MGDRSIAADGSAVVTGPQGQLGHRDHLAQSEILAPRLITVRPGVWCLMGNGLSNQTFVEGPEGIIAIDTGESTQEMTAAIAALRTVTDRPVVAVVYTHFHYVTGTQAVLDTFGRHLPVLGHERIVVNRSRVASEIGPAYARGLVQQFGINMDHDGPDGMINIGLGLDYRNPAHAPHTVGFVPPTITFTDEPSVHTVAGLRMEVTSAPSDADDSVTLWFPELGTCVHNIIWPVLFNVFAIRGEEYRDPQILLRGMDHLISLGAEHLVAAHGPSISGADEVRRRATRARDSIQYLWDQTVRGINKGWTTDELASRVRLPDYYDDDHLTAERYGVAEHHVRQIHNGLRGWFDGDIAKLFPLEPAERAQRLVTGFGGRDEVARQAEAALDADDVRWAAELAAWLVAAPGATQDDRNRLARVLRTIAYRSPAANIRCWCITAARDLDRTKPLDANRTHRFRRPNVIDDPITAVRTLRVLVDPSRMDGLDVHVALDFGDGRTCGIHLRNHVCANTDGTGAPNRVQLSGAALADLLTGERTWEELLTAGAVRVTGDTAGVARAMGVFELPARKR